MNRDQNGWIGQIDPGHPVGIEMGDAVGWNGHYIALNPKANKTIEEYIEFFETKTAGVWVRHPDELLTNNGFGAYYKGHYHGVISRDQLCGILHALAMRKAYKASLRLIMSHARRGFLFCNNTLPNGQSFKDPKRKWPDLTFFDIWAVMIRCLWPYSFFMYPILCILDLHILLNAFVMNLDRGDDIISPVSVINVSRQIAPTPASYLAAKVVDKPFTYTKLAIYWKGFRENPEMTEMFWQDIVKW